MEDGKNSKPIEIPLRGRPRKRDAETDADVYSSMMQGYFENKEVYAPQQFADQVQFLKPTSSFQQSQEPMQNGYPKQQNRPNSSIHDDMLSLLGFEECFPQRTSYPTNSQNDYSDPMKSQTGAEGQQDKSDVRLSDYLDPSSIKQMSFQGYSIPQDRSSQFRSDQKGSNGQKLPEFSSFINEFKLNSKDLRGGTGLGSAQQSPHRPFVENFGVSFESPETSYLQKDPGNTNAEDAQQGSARSGQYAGSKQRSVHGEGAQSNPSYVPGRVESGQVNQGFYTDVSPHLQPVQGGYSNGTFKNRYPFREEFSQPRTSANRVAYSSESPIRNSFIGAGNFVQNSFQHPQNQEADYNMHRALGPRANVLQPGYMAQPMFEMDQDRRLMASIFPGEHSSFRNPVQQGYPSSGNIGQNSSSWMNRKKRKNNPLLWQYIKTNQTFHPSIIHPSKYSSLDFIQGADNGQKMYLGSVKRPSSEKGNGNSIFPLFLNSNKELTDEFKGVVQNFRNSISELDFGNVTVQQLKNLMKEFGLNHTGKKNELIERLQGILKKIDGKEAQKPEEQQLQERSKEPDDFGFYFF